MFLCEFVFKIHKNKTLNASDNTLGFKARNANFYCDCGNQCWLVVVDGAIILYFLLGIFQNGQREWKFI